jgi:hypothetical protein
MAHCRLAEDNRPVVIGPRLKAELARRIRELEARFRPTPAELRELAQLREFLRITPADGGDNDTARRPRESALDRL